MIVLRPGSGAASPVDDEKVTCIIRDFVDSNGGITRKHTLNLPASLPARKAAEDIARACGYIENTVSVHFEVTLGNNEDILLEKQDESISLGTVCSSGARRHNFSIQELDDGTLPQKMDQAAAVPENRPFVELQVCGVLPSCSSTSSEDFSYNQSIIKSEVGYLGLVNQAMTCYLNSLLQTLFMTPEFRNALYRWTFDGTEDEAVKSIPYQLQRLFLQLQTSNKRAVETTDLTKSFGWDSSEVWQQHDVQELCRVMFDALEQKWKNTVQANLINQLYQGKMKDYVKCLECGYESARVDAYLDIPLVIRPFGSSDAYGSVMEAMNAFVQPETLDGTNQYFCERCNKKCNAHKGLKFVSFPYMLTLQLKRFDFDYATMHRIKLNDKMTFPEVLDLNTFITASKDNSEGEGDEVNAGNTVVFSNSSDEGIDEGIEVEAGYSVASTSSDSSNISSDAAANNTRNSFYSSGCEGPYVYELFSIMIHSGSAAGGHYYAYIKSFKEGHWYSFNDQQVSKITYDDIRKTYGGSAMGRGFYTSAYTSSTSAYMFMYRRIDKTLNADFMQPEQFPEILKAELQKQKAKEEAERRQREIDKSTCKIKVYCFQPLDQRKMNAKLEIHKDKTLEEATDIARHLFELEGTVSMDCCRLVKYDEQQDSLEKSFEGAEQSVIATILGGVKAYYTFDLLLETKQPEQQFLEYRPGDVTVKVHHVDIFSGIIHPPFNVRVYHSQIVSELKQMLTKMLGLSTPTMRLVLERYPNELKLLVDPQKSLKSEGFYKSNKVFLECSGDPEDNSLQYPQTALCHLVDQYQHTIRITCCLPSQASVQTYLSSIQDCRRRNTSSKPCHDPGLLSDERGHVDEGISENDSAFYSGDTTSKHSLSGLDQGSNFSLSSLSPESRLNQSIASGGLAVDTEASKHFRGSSFGKEVSKTWRSSACRLSHVDEAVSVSADGEVSAYSNEDGEPSDTSQLSSCKSEHSMRVELAESRTERKLQSATIQHSSSHEQLSMDVADLYSKLSSVGIASCRSDPSIYHSCQDYSDSSLQCLGSGPSSGSRDDTSTSAEFNFSCSGPDPEPILSSPEDGYGFEEEEHDCSDVVNAWNLSCQLPEGGAFEPASHCKSAGTSKAPSSNLDAFYTEEPAMFQKEDWDKEYINEMIGEKQGLSDNHGKTVLPLSSQLTFSPTDRDSCQSSSPSLPPPPPPPPPPPTPSFVTGSLVSPFPSSSSSSVSSLKTKSVKGDQDGDEEEDPKRYFHAVMNPASDDEDRVLHVSVDKRITLGAFKQELEPHIGVPSNLFKVYKVYSNNQEFESVRLSDTLSFFEDGKFNIKLGRALLPGEHRVKVFQLCVNEPEPCKYLLETIFAKGMSVLESKHLIIREVKQQCSLDVPLNRCRLRKKSWTNPGTVYIDSHIYENEIPIYPNWDVFLEIIKGPEELLDTSQLAVYVRQWQPSKYVTGPFQEVVLKYQSVEELKSQISAASGIPAERVEFAKGRGTFPCEISVLEIHTDLEWNPQVSMLNMWPLYICDDGHVVYFRDSTEVLGKMSDQQKKEIQQKENRTFRFQRISISPRKERALKIYTDDDEDTSTSHAA